VLVASPVVSVYPHRGFWAERCEDGIRLAKKIKRDNVGTYFNLVHWKWQPERQPLDKLLKEALPHLKCVTINGLAGDRIVSLSDGDFDIDSVVATLRKVGFKGPVGLQGYSVPGPSAEHLARSMRRWREAVKE
jgi:sugar phosphate isomerase/epimerase